MSNLRVTIIQSKLHWEDIDANLKMFDQKLEGLADKTDLIILPEMFTTGFSTNAAHLGEGMNGKTMEWLKEKAAALDCVITGSFIAEVQGRYLNRLVWMRPYGTYEVYDKRHLFTLANEHKYYTAGNKKLVVELKGWKVCPLICYDLRFPVWSRNVENYDLLLYVANFPAKRSYAWKTLLNARAIENQAYTIGVNRVGKDGNDLHYSGDSGIIDFMGKALYQVAEDEAIYTEELNYQDLQDFRKKLAFLADQDQFSIQ